MNVFMKKVKTDQETIVVLQLFAQLAVLIAAVFTSELSGCVDRCSASFMLSVVIVLIHITAGG